ncbi:hypothetical protein BsWGS_06636 [Bradybaena similaris]
MQDFGKYIQKIIMNLWALIASTAVMYTSGFRIVCYYTNSVPYSPEMVIFQTKDFDPSLCTHLVYSHAMVAGLILSPSQPNDEPTKTNEGMYKQVQALKQSNPQLKILLGVGSLMEKPDSFLEAASSQTSRATFASSVASFLLLRKFDGVQLEWANLATQPNPLYDKNRFVLFLKALRKEFNETYKKHNTELILAVTLPAIKSHIDRGYKIPELVREADFISVRALDLPTAFGGKVGLSAPLHSHPAAVGEGRYLSVEWIANYYISLKVPNEKINIGIPTFGRSFTLKYGSLNKTGAAAFNQEGHATNIITSYYEMCKLIHRGGSVGHVEAQGGRYYTDGSLWVSYEDILSVAQKTCYIRKLGLGGMTFWTLNLDDFDGIACLHGTYPLIRTAANLMTYERPAICSETNLTRYVDVPNPVSVIPKRPERQTEVAKRIVCYFTNAGQYGQGLTRVVPEDIKAELCTHIVYTYGVFKGLTIVPYFETDKSKPWLEGMYGRVVRLKKRNPNLKVLLGVGGGMASYNMGDQIADSSSLVELAKSTVMFLEENQFDGLQLTWREPSSRWKANFAYFIQILRSAFSNQAAFHRQPELLLSLAMVNAKDKIDSGYGDEISRIAASVDFMSLMTYDFHGSSDERTRHSSPLFSSPSEQNDERYLNVDWVAKYYVALGVPRHQLDIGIASYGHSFTLHNADDHNLKSPVSGPGQPGRFTGIPGLLAYYEVCDFISAGANVRYVPDQRVTYAYSGTQWVAFDDIKSVVDKVCYANTYGFGGVNFYSVDYDDVTGEFCKMGDYPLLRVINNTMTNVNEACENFRLKATSCSGVPFCNKLLYFHSLFILPLVSFYQTLL